jgi:TolB protein
VKSLSLIFLLGVAILLLLPVTIFSQNDFLKVTAPGNRLLQLVLIPPQPISGEINEQVAAEILEIFKFDLTLTGIFTLVDPIAAVKPTVSPYSQFDLAQWKSSDADMLLRIGYSISADSITFEYRLYDLTTGREVLAKRYSALKQDLRRTAHTFADDMLNTLTGERSAFNTKIAFVSNATGNKEIYLMDCDGYNIQRVTNNGSINLNPDFSPSGKEIIYTSYKQKNPDLYRRELFTGSEFKVSSAPGINITGAFSPEGNRIALAMSKDGNSEIYLITKEGKQLLRLTNHAAIDISPAWSPDGRFIAFVSDRFGKPQIFVTRFDGTDLRRLTTTGGYNVNPRWSPKGDRIAYSRQYGNGFQIHTINPDGSDDKQLTFEGSSERPRWSPDGRFIVFSSKRGQNEAIYIMRADGSAQKKVSRNSSYKDSHPTWAPR